MRSVDHALIARERDPFGPLRFRNAINVDERRRNEAKRHLLMVRAAHYAGEARDDLTNFAPVRGQPIQPRVEDAEA